MSSGEAMANGYGGADAQMAEIGNAADFSYAFSTTTGFKVRHSLAAHGLALGQGLFVCARFRRRLICLCIFPVLAVTLKWSCFERLHANAVLPGSPRQADAQKTGE